MSTFGEILKFLERHAKENGFKMNPEKKVVETLIQGILHKEKEYGARYCPCRTVTGDKEKDKPKICPCAWHKEEIKKWGHCYCHLFVSKYYKGGTNGK